MTKLTGMDIQARVTKIMMDGTFKLKREVARAKREHEDMKSFLLAEMELLIDQMIADGIPITPENQAIAMQIFQNEYTASKADNPYESDLGFEKGVRGIEKNEFSNLFDSMYKDKF